MYGGLSRKMAGFSNAVQGTQPGEDKVSMAEVKYSEEPGALISTFIWSGLHSGDRGEPIRNVSGNISFQIAADFGVVLVWQEDHMVRHIYLTDKHSPNVKPSWFGESIGHYENGDTLVVDTIGLNTKTFVDSYQTPHTEQLHVVERYRMNVSMIIDCVEATHPSPH
jgi:hypothetical protein